MARSFFDNLPSTRTPVTAPRLNGLLDGDEAMGNIVVDSIRTKNMLNINTFTKGRINTTTGNPEYPERVSTLTIGSNSVLVTTTQSWSGIHTDGYIEVDEDETYNLSFTTTNASSSWAGLVCYDSSFNYLGEATKTTISTTTNASYNFTFPTNTKYIRVVLQNTTAATITYSNLQLEKGSTATDYAPYQNLNASIYEEGTFTPTVFGDTASGTASYTLQQGKYIRIGKLVQFEIKIGCTLANSSGLLLIGGLPFNVFWKEPGIMPITTTLTSDTQPWLARVYGKNLVIGKCNLDTISNKNWSSTAYIYVTGTLMMP